MQPCSSLYPAGSKYPSAQIRKRQRFHVTEFLQGLSAAVAKVYGAPSCVELQRWSAALGSKESLWLRAIGHMVLHRNELLEKNP